MATLCCDSDLLGGPVRKRELDVYVAISIVGQCTNSKSEITAVNSPEPLVSRDGTVHDWVYFVWRYACVLRSYFSSVGTKYAAFARSQREVRPW